MRYNTQEKRMPLPEYGRSIQNMVDHALTIEDRETRQHCANTIVEIMASMYPQLKDQPDFQHKLWDHLAIMSNFQLDIEYPYEIIQKDNLDTKPDPIPYPDVKIHYKHYGRLLERLIKAAVKMPNGDEKQHLIALIGNHMKKDYQTWNKDTVEISKIATDLYELSDKEIELTPELISLMEHRLKMVNKPKAPYSKGNTMKKNKR